MHRLDNNSERRGDPVLHSFPAAAAAPFQAYLRKHAHFAEKDEDFSSLHWGDCADFPVSIFRRCLLGPSSAPPLAHFSSSGSNIMSTPLAGASSAPLLLTPPYTHPHTRSLLS